MAAVLHLLKGGDPALPFALIEQQVRAGDDVTVAVLPGASAPDVPTGVRIRRVSTDLSYGELVELVFAADHVVTW